jgi:hypothetical protein
MSRYDISEFEAQAKAADMIAVLAGLAMDVTQPAGVRRDCANDVLDRAYGKVAIRADPPATVDPASAEGAKTSDMIEAMKRTSAELQLIDQWMARPQEEWPAHVKEAAGRLGDIAFYADEAPGHAG